ncbi:MAG: DEAD/DEAH box helicase [Bacteroidota bacterium]
MKFNELKIIEPILKALTEKGYSEPTPIQAKAIPLILKRKDILGCAQTGTGKTAAFAIPIIQLINKHEKFTDPKPRIRALIVTPTRELAIQIDENIKAYSKHTKITHAVIFGGVKQGQQVEKLKRGVHVLTATPGRLLDLVGQGFISLDELKLFVLDEADRMLDMGFIHDIKKILQLIPEKRQSLFFSATMPSNIVKLAHTILKNPEKVEVTPASTTAETIQQYVYYTNRNTKLDLLLHILEEKNIEQVLVFARTKHGADRIARNLTKKGVVAKSIHGDKAQNQRQKALQLFKDRKIRVLVATDIAARGIDIDKLQYVVNYEIPNMPETYVHRIGRSGRAGEEGIAISLCEPEENAFIKDIQKLIGNKIETAQNDAYPQTDKPMTEEEKKEWQKEKQRRKQEFFANRKAAREKRKEGKNGGSTAKKSKNAKKEAAKNDRGNQKKKGSAPSDKSAEKKENRQNANSGQKKNSKANTASSKKKTHKKRRNGRRNTDASDALKSKFMWPLE